MTSLLYSGSRFQKDAANYILENPIDLCIPGFFCMCYVNLMKYEGFYQSCLEVLYPVTNT